MKPESMPHGPSAWPDAMSPVDLSAKTVLLRQIAELSQWLTSQGLDLQNDAHTDAGTRDHLYLRYGVLIGLKQALALLTSDGETVH